MAVVEALELIRWDQVAAGVAASKGPLEGEDVDDLAEPFGELGVWRCVGAEEQIEILVRPEQIWQQQLAENGEARRPDGALAAHVRPWIPELGDVGQVVAQLDVDRILAGGQVRRDERLVDQTVRLDVAHVVSVLLGSGESCRCPRYADRGAGAMLELRRPYRWVQHR